MGLIRELEDCASVRQKQDLHISFLIPKPKERCGKKSKQKHFKNLSMQCSSNRNNYQIFQIGWIPIGFSQGEKRVWLCAHMHTRTCAHAHKVYFFSQTQQGCLGGMSRAEYFRTVLFRSPAMRRVPSFCFLRQYTSLLFPRFPFTLLPLSIDLRGSASRFQQYRYLYDCKKKKIWCK